MRQLVQRCALVVLIGGLWAVAAAPARAQAAQPVTKVEIITTDNKELQLDLASPRDRATLDSLLSEGRVQHLAVAAPARPEGKHLVEKVVVTKTDHKDQKLDLTDPKDRLTLVSLLREGKVEKLAEDKPPNLLDIRWDLGLWTIVVFVLLFLILRKMAWGPMLEGLKKREDAIRSAVEEAKIARAETERVRADFKAQMDKAYAEIPKIMDEARRDAAQLAEEMRAKANADIQTERQRLRREIETARDQALKQLQEFAADLATRISMKVLKRAISADDHRRLVDESIAEMRQAGKTA